MIRKLFYTTTALALATTIGLTAMAQNKDVKLSVTDLGSGIYMIEGAGGNVGLSVGDDGAFLIDDQFAHMSEKILAAVAERSDQPLSYVINTHYHGDHTGGNEQMADSGAAIVAHDNVRKRLLESQEQTSEAALPVITFSKAVTFHWNDHEVFISHPLNAHTDGDAVVMFKDANIIHLGDTFFSGRWPYIDLDGGGTVAGYITNLEYYAGEIDADTKVIPGHGPLSNRQDIEEMIAILKDSQQRVLTLKQAGKTEAEIIAAKPLGSYESYDWRFISSEIMIKTFLKDAAL
jgi:cyclase